MLNQQTPLNETVYFFKQTRDSPKNMNFYPVIRQEMRHYAESMYHVGGYIVLAYACAYH